MPPGPNVQCFWCEPMPLAQESFRRLVFSDTEDRPKCSNPGGYHNAEVFLDDVPWTETEYRGFGKFPTDEQKKDPRWPAHCACGYEFRPDDPWYYNQEQYLRRVDTGEKFLVRYSKAPAGAMFNATWTRYGDRYLGPDGICLAVVLPDGTEWHVDCPSSDGNPWQRSGIIPNVTASPSIRSHRYHGFLRNGVLEACGDSET